MPVVTCRCGKVEVAFRGAPILGSTCHCDDCQAAARQLEALPGAEAITDAADGTPYLLYRRDRMDIVRGGDLLVAHKLKPESPTSRMFTRCCNSAMMVQFDSGPHWVSAYRMRMAPGAPPIEMRLQTRFAPAGVVLPDDVPSYSFAPARFVLKLIGARIAMLFGR